MRSNSINGAGISAAGVRALVARDVFDDTEAAIGVLQAAHVAPRIEI